MLCCLNCEKELTWKRQNANKYCSNDCQREYQYKTRVSQWLNEGKDWKGMIPNWVRRYLRESRGYACECCGITDYMSKPLTLEVDHIDGMSYNNSISNLRLLCPNCHSQTDTYKNRNKGNGRKR